MLRKIALTFSFLLAATIVSAQPKQAPNLYLRDLNNRPVKMSSYRGKVVLINFWATWCIPCRAEIPDLIKMQQRYRNAGLRIVGITYPPEEKSEVRRFARALRINYRIGMGTKAIKALFTASETLPMTIIIDRDGFVRDVIEGIMYADEFDEKVKPLLATEHHAARL